MQFPPPRQAPHAKKVYGISRTQRTGASNDPVATKRLLPPQLSPVIPDILLNPCLNDQVHFPPLSPTARAGLAFIAEVPFIAWLHLHHDPLFDTDRGPFYGMAPSALFSRGGAFYGYKTYHKDMVEARIHFRLDYASYIYIYQVF